MVIERLVDKKQISEDEERFSWSLRPKNIKEYIGQKNMIEKLNIALQAAKIRNEPLEHCLFSGPPGLGKTTLSYIIATEMGANLVPASGPTLDKKGDLMGILTNLEEGDVLFIDEIHRLSIAVEEFIYPAMEDFKTDFIIDKGAFAKSIKIPLKPFTLIGATTRKGLLSAPLRDRFGLFYHIDFYPPEELTKIVIRSAELLETKVDKDAALEIARRSRGTPRIVNRLLRRVRDFALVKSDGNITMDVTAKALKLEGIDSAGLDQLDRSFLTTIIEYYDGGPVGIEAIAATLDQETDTLVDTVEPYLLKIGFLARTRGGRVVKRNAYEHLGLEYDSKEQSALF